VSVQGKRGAFGDIFLQVQVADAAEGVVAQLVPFLRLRRIAGREQAAYTKFNPIVI